MSNRVNHWHKQAQLLLNQKQFQQAHTACIEILKLVPQHADAHFLLGMIALNMQQMSKSIELIKKAITLQPSNAEYHAFLARCFSLVNRYKEARAEADLAIQYQSSSAIVLDTLGVVYSRIGDHQKAVSLFEKAIAIQPNNPSFYYNQAASLKFIGNFTQAKSAYEKVIQLQPNYYQAHSALAELQTATLENNNIARLETSLKNIENNTVAKLHICHALAKELECLGDYAKALDYLKMGNGAKKQQLNYSIEQDIPLFSHMKNLFSSNFKAEIVTGHPSKKPIFVLGMPRSGTTLVDRILSSHSDVISAGELQNFAVTVKKHTHTKSRQVLDTQTIEACAKLDFNLLGQAYLSSCEPIISSNLRFIDKMPLNFLYVGLIKKALPNAKIIILNRHPMDVCISNFRTLFAVNFSYYNYAYDLIDTAKYYCLFKELMAFWDDAFPNQLLNVCYEELVENPQQQISRILDYCELDWQDACLNFHSNSAPVSTASSVQVRQPMNNQSIGRWKRYGKEVKELETFFKEKDML